MAKKLGVYKCGVCGNMVEVLHNGGGTLVCCNQDMKLLKEKTEDGKTEKHVPFVEEVENGYFVKVGEAQDHPMTEDHWVVWIELIIDGKVYRQELKPGEKPEATFCVEKGEDVKAREYCNLHGLWTN